MCVRFNPEKFSPSNTAAGQGTEVRVMGPLPAMGPRLSPKVAMGQSRACSSLIQEQLLMIISADDLCKCLLDCMKKFGSLI
jgi:hypothetical protein